MIITTLIENTQENNNSDLSAEHGLSLHLSYKNKAILFDTGASDAFSWNANKLGIDLGAVDVAVLSHHHYDHSGGLRRFLSVNKHANVYLKAQPDGEPYFKARLLPKRYVGLDRELLTAYPKRFVLVDRLTEILPNVYIFPDIGEAYPKPKGNKNLFVKRRTGWSLDTFSHELTMAIRENDEIVIITGCAHNGALNIIDTVEKEFSGIPIKAVVDGFHLVGLQKTNSAGDSESEIQRIAHKILTYSIRKVYTGHCTGRHAYAALKSVLGARLHHLQTGAVLQL